MPSERMYWDVCATKREENVDVGDFFVRDSERASLCLLVISAASMILSGERGAALVLDLGFMGKFE